MFLKLHKTLQHLPVARKADEIVTSIIDGFVTILSAETGSGKTLYASSLLAQSVNNQVVVLVPRRFLALNAAETIAELSQTKLGQEVGYAVGTQSGEQSCYGEGTRLLFVTYGYAIASNLINTARTIVLDEVHEADMNMSICRALLLRRITRGEQIQVMEMSATINAERQASYWSNSTDVKTFQVDGVAVPCKVRHEKDSMENVVADLINSGRKGIVVFRPGVAEVEETVMEINDELSSRGISATVSMIYGEMSAKERKKATAGPAEGEIKILVGTNVVESGVNLMWLDAGVSCGTGKVPVARESGAVMLDLVDLSKWRLQQQKGRVNRSGNRADTVFGEAEFVLVSPKSWEDRESETLPEIVRLPLTELVMHCARFMLRADELTFDFPPPVGAIEKAEKKLERLGLITSKRRLTPAGRFVSGLPVGPETGAMLWHAKETGILGAFLALAAVVEVDGVRKNFRDPHYEDYTSDHLDSLKAFLAVKKILHAKKKHKGDAFKTYNVGYKRFHAAKNLLRILNKRLGHKASSTMKASDRQLRQCLVAGFIDQIFRASYDQVSSLDTNDHNTYRLGNGSALHSLNEDFAIGRLRTIKPRNGNAPFTVLEKVTEVTLEDIEAVAAVREGILEKGEYRDKVDPLTFHTVRAHRLFGEYDLESEVVESTLSQAECEEITQFISFRNALQSRLANLSGMRETYGLPVIRCYETHWSIGYLGDNILYSEEEVSRLERLVQEINSVKNDINRITHQRENAGLIGVRYTDKGFRFGFSGSTHPYTKDGVSQAEEETNIEITELQSSGSLVTDSLGSRRQRRQRRPRRNRA